MLNFEKQKLKQGFIRVLGGLRICLVWERKFEVNQRKSLKDCFFVYIVVNDNDCIILLMDLEVFIIKMLSIGVMDMLIVRFSNFMFICIKVLFVYYYYVVFVVN